MKMPDPQFLELCGKARDGALTAEELAHLEGRLLGDPEARVFYRRFMQVQSVLERHGAELMRDQEAGEVPAGTASQSPPFRSVVSRIGLTLAAAAACLAVALALAYVVSRDDPPGNHVTLPGTAVSDVPRLEAIGSGVAVLREGEEHRIPLKGAFELNERDVIRTDGDSRAMISYAGEGTALILSTGSRVHLGRTGAGGKHVQLDAGFLTCQVDPQRPGREMTLTTPHGRFAVLGTAFVLSTDREATEVAVSEGRVQVEFSGRQEVVQTGESLTLRRNRTVRGAIRAGRGETEIEKFVLVNVDAIRPVEGHDPLLHNAVINLAQLSTRKLNIRAIPRGEVTCVYLELKGWHPDGRRMSFPRFKNANMIRKWQAHAPYYMAGDIGFTDRPHIWTPEPGEYVLKAVVYKDPRHQHPVGRPTKIRFKVVDDKSPDAATDPGKE